MFSFNEGQIIELDKQKGDQSYRAFMCYVLGLIKVHLQELKGEYAGLFDVRYEGGKIGEYLLIQLKKDPVGSIEFGTALGRLSYNSNIGEDSGELYEEMKKSYFSVSTLHNFIKKAMKNLFEKGAIEEILAKKKVTV